MMPIWKFEIQSHIYIEVDGDSAEEARMKLVDRRVKYDLDQDPYISNGQLVEGDKDE